MQRPERHFEPLAAPESLLTMEGMPTLLPTLLPTRAYATHSFGRNHFFMCLHFSFACASGPWQFSREYLPADSITRTTGWDGTQPRGSQSQWFLETTVPMWTGSLTCLLCHPKELRTYRSAVLTERPDLLHGWRY